MKEILVLIASLAAPAPSGPILELAEGEFAHCQAAEGCVVMTKRALGDLIDGLAKEAAKSCGKRAWI